MDHVLETLELQLQPEHCALLIIDLQNDFCAVGGYLQREKHYDVGFAGEVAARLEIVAAQVRQWGATVAWLRSVYDFKYLTNAHIAKRVQEGCCLEGSWGTEFFQIKPVEGDLVVDKHHFSGFADTTLDTQLRKRGVKTLLITGVATNVCVDSTLRDGFFLGYHIVMLDDCVGSNSRAGHEGTLATVRNNIGHVLGSEALLRMLQERAEV